jgi:hypothetical protein
MSTPFSLGNASLVDSSLDSDHSLSATEKESDVESGSMATSIASRLNGNFTGILSRGRIQVGVGEARSRKKKSSESVHVAGPRGPSRPSGLYILYTNVAT